MGLRRMLAFVVIVGALVAGWVWRHRLMQAVRLVLPYRLRPKRTTEEVVRRLAPVAEDFWRQTCPALQEHFPPRELVLIGLKQEKVLEVWVPEKSSGTWQMAHAFPILAASGKPGPKLREGDCQVPEGLYRIAGLNPNSRFHLSMKVNYPNDEDLRLAEAEGRHSPGTDIFIHGGAASVGCLAIGDEAIELLFSLVDQVGWQNVKVILAPYDFRRRPPDVSHAPHLPWLSNRYADIVRALASFTRP